MSSLLEARPQYDDLFVYAPSFALLERQLAEGGPPTLDEGKYVGTASQMDLEFADSQRAMDAMLFPERFADERKKGATVGKRAFKKIQARTHEELLAAVLAHDRGETWDDDFRRDATRIMKKAWKEVFQAGVRASGIEGPGRGKAGVKLDPRDEKWLRSAMQHEMRFLNRFVTAVTDQTYVMPLPQRTRMYMDALESFYDSARVIGLPHTVSIRWQGKTDKRVCDSCKYLVANNPWTKYTMPTVPRAGLTICLTNCRHRLLIRVVSTKKWIELLNKKPNRDTAIRHLRKLKKRAHG